MEKKEFKDMTLVCKDCNCEFVWTAGEQEFYQEKGFTNPPARCPKDRERRKAERNFQKNNRFNNRVGR